MTLDQISTASSQPNLFIAATGMEQTGQGTNWTRNKLDKEQTGHPPIVGVKCLALSRLALAVLKSRGVRFAVLHFRSCLRAVDVSGLGHAQMSLEGVAHEI
jgi:hypothetical protein